MTSRNLKNATKLSLLIALGALASLQASPARADDHDHRSPSRQAPTVISACPATGIVISEPGDYILDAGGLGLRLLNCNFSVSGTNGITITASDVNLSLNNSRLMCQYRSCPSWAASSLAFFLWNPWLRLRSIKNKTELI